MTTQGARPARKEFTPSETRRYFFYRARLRPAMDAVRDMLYAAEPGVPFHPDQFTALWQFAMLRRQLIAARYEAREAAFKTDNGRFFYFISKVLLPMVFDRSVEWWHLVGELEDWVRRAYVVAADRGHLNFADQLAWAESVYFGVAPA